MSSGIAPPIKAITAQSPPCPVCSSPSEWLDALEFNRSCEEARGKVLPPSGVLVAYALCRHCGFCFAPQIHAWPAETFEQWIYNDAYAEVDPDFLGARPQSNAQMLCTLFPQPPQARHLDYGGGNGMLAEALRQRGWDSHSYDPFLERSRASPFHGQFDLITAFEVFEHVPDVNALIRDLERLRTPTGVVLFSTLVSDAEVGVGQPLRWWYAAPRNGHISLYSRKSLGVLAGRLALNCGSFSDNLHVLFGTVPSWAQQVIRTG